MDIITVFSKKYYDQFLNELFNLSEDALKYYESGIVRFKFSLYRNDVDVGAAIDMIDQATGNILLRLPGFPKTFLHLSGLTDIMKESYILKITDRIEDLNLDLELFHFFSNTDAATKEARLLKVIEKLKENTEYVYDPEKANKALKAIGFTEDIPAGPNGLAPNYAGLIGKKYKGKDAIFQVIRDGKEAVSGIIPDFPYTSSRELDFAKAYKMLGLTADEIKKIERDYVWHHLDDFNPVTGKGSMQLVLKELHNSWYLKDSMNHTGGVAIWSSFYQIFYR